MRIEKYPDNSVRLLLPSLSANENSARAMVSSFVSLLNPTLEELADIKCAVSEAVTNAIVQGYKNGCGIVQIDVKLMADRTVKLEIRDRGCGIEDVERAMQPLFTTDAASERSGMGFTVMESFTDKLRVVSKPGKGTRVIMEKKLAPLPKIYI